MSELKETLAENLLILRPIVAKVYLESKIMQDLCLAQAILESRLVKNPSSLAKTYNNLFGVKKAGTHNPPFISLPTTEYVNGKKIIIDQRFGWNKTLEDSIKQHRQVLELQRYKPVWKAESFNAAADQIRQCGYATDPHYTALLIHIYNQYLS